MRIFRLIFRDFRLFVFLGRMCYAFTDCNKNFYDRLRVSTVIMLQAFSYLIDDTAYFLTHFFRQGVKNFCEVLRCNYLLCNLVNVQVLEIPPLSQSVRPRYWLFTIPMTPLL